MDTLLYQSRGVRQLFVLLLATQAVVCRQQTDASSEQHVLSNDEHIQSPGQLHGRFMHITDFHPDAFYKTYASTAKDGACHSGEGSAGYYGAETSDCDSPLTLINATFDWLRDNVKDTIDFVIWTGDSARHDNDESIPREKHQIKQTNEIMVKKWKEVFGRKKDQEDSYDELTIPIIPNLGNNDFLPHNIFDLGPNTWTREYLNMWQSFIPEEERHEFDQSGWFAVDVIPNHLTVFSLNTMYFFQKNAAVDGCSLRGEPGYRQLEWLRVQLQFLRQRGMKAMIMGHVPPARTDGKQLWDETCWQKYTMWMRQYRDVVTGTFFGHMNLDHFLVQDFKEIDPELEKGYGIDIEPAQEVHKKDTLRINSATSYIGELRDYLAKIPTKPKSKSTLEEWNTLEGVFNASSLPKKKPSGREGSERDYLKAIGGKYAERYSVSFVSPSIIPLYYPTFRIYEYNLTGITSKPPSMDITRPQMNYHIETTTKKQEKKAIKRRNKRRFTIPDPPSKTAAPGPAYSPQRLSLMKYTQYYANLTRINNDFNATHPPDHERSIHIDGKWKDGKHGKHNGKKARPGGDPKPKQFVFEVLYDSKEDKVYKLEDLTVKSYIELAQNMARGAPALPQEYEVDPSVQIGSDHENDLSDGSDWDDSHLGQSDLVNVTRNKNKYKDDNDDNDKKKKEKKKKRKHRKGSMNKTWHTFIRRAFVDTMTDQEIKDEFGS